MSNYNNERLIELEARLAEVEQARDSAFETWKKFHQDTLAAFIKNEHEPLKARLAEAEATLRKIADHAIESPSQAAYWARSYFAADSASDDTALGPGEEWWMDIAGVPVKLDEWEPGAKKRKADQPGEAGK